jgi:hypothetical protein
MFSMFALVLAVAVVPLRASDPVGLYCMIDKVVLEPSDGAPARIQIWGAFSVAIPRAADFSQPKPPGSFGDARVGDVYAAVEKGYLYYTCPPDKEAQCRNEWADLKSIAGTHKVVGIGSRWSQHVRVRPASQKLEAPDAYALNVGVVPIGQFGSRPGTTNQTQYPDLIAALEAAIKGK